MILPFLVILIVLKFDPCPGLPDPPMDVRVDSGPQDGTILVTWIPVTLNITNPGQKVPPTTLQIEIIIIIIMIVVMIITIVIIKVKTAPITGYAVFADGKRVTDVDSPSSNDDDDDGDDDHDDGDHEEEREENK